MWTLAHQTKYLHIEFTSYKQCLLIWSFLLWKTKEDSNRPKCTTNFLYCLKRSNSQPFKSSNWKLFLQCVNNYTTCFEKCFLFHVISLSLFWGSFQPYYSCFHWNKWFRRSSYFIFYLQNNSALLIPKF